MNSQETLDINFFKLFALTTERIDSYLVICLVFKWFQTFNVQAFEKILRKALLPDIYRITVIHNLKTLFETFEQEKLKC